MNFPDDQMADLELICPEAQVFEEGGVTYIHLPRLLLPASCEPGQVEGLLRPGSAPDGYTSRLFLSAAFTHRGQNWTTHRILDKTWHAFSYNNVTSDLRLIEILANHVKVLQ